jgi:hypothetical protein
VAAADRSAAGPAGKQAVDSGGLLTGAVVGCSRVAGCVTQGGRSPTEAAHPATARSRKGPRGLAVRGRPDMERVLHANEETTFKPRGVGV